MGAAIRKYHLRTRHVPDSAQQLAGFQNHLDDVSVCVPHGTDVDIVMKVEDVHETQFGTVPKSFRLVHKEE